MQNTTKEAGVKLFAIIGLIATVSVLFWLTAEGVRMAPQAFSSVANALSAFNQDELALFTERSVVNSGDAFGMEWVPKSEGSTYSLSYVCAEGISLEVRSGENANVLTCEEFFALSTEGTASIIMTAETRRFSDVTLIITETHEETSAERTASTVVTVVNKDIPLSESISVVEESRSENDVAPVVVPSTSGTTFPISDPNGVSDLSVTYLGTGVYNDATGAFTNAQLDNDIRGSVQFAVTNLGNKISEPWGFTAELPTNPVATYTSDLQEVLRPNERVVLTLSFGDVAEAGTHDLHVELVTSDDANTGNNTFDVTVAITD